MNIKLSENETLLVSIHKDGLYMWYQVKTGKYSIMEYSYIIHTEQHKFDYYIKEAVLKFHEGYIQCCYCGKWIKKEEAHHHAPTGCACNDCDKKALEDEKEFLGGLD